MNLWLISLRHYFFQKRTIFLEIFFFLGVLFYFTWLNSSLVQVDPDSFYHAKIGEYLARGEIVKNFPWFSATLLNSIWVDHHFLYHLLIVPFVIFFNPLLGIKLAAIFFATLFIFLFHKILKSLNIRYPFVYCLSLLLTTSFIFRLSLAKAPAPSLIFLFIIVYLLFVDLNLIGFITVFILSFLYIWLYGGWPIILVIAIIYWFVSEIERYHNARFKKNNINLVLKKIKYKFNQKFSKNLFPQSFLKNEVTTKIILVSAGLVSGLIINPYFPVNVKFYWWQTFLIPFRNYKQIIGVGGEWYAFNFFDLVGSSITVFIFLILAFLFFFINYRKQNKISWTLFLLTIIFFVMTLSSRRHVEYFIPFAVLFSAYVLNASFRDYQLKTIWQKVCHYVPRKVIFFLVVYISCGLLLTSIDDIRVLKKNLSTGYGFGVYEKASQWLSNNTPFQSIVFHSDWDETPVLFFHNDHNRYIVGLDPVFMYGYNQDLYWLWHDITLAQKKDSLAQIIKEKFIADFVFIDKSHKEMNRSFSSNPDFSLVYQDNEAWIYKIN